MSVTNVVAENGIACLLDQDIKHLQTGRTQSYWRFFVHAYLNESASQTETPLSKELIAKIFRSDHSWGLLCKANRKICFRVSKELGIRNIRFFAAKLTVKDMRTFKQQKKYPTENFLLLKRALKVVGFMLFIIEQFLTIVGVKMSLFSIILVVQKEAFPLFIYNS